jgi:glycosyltransferase involved in cell wall biosynthesis
MVDLGHDVTLIGPLELGITKEKFTDLDYRTNYQNSLKTYLQLNAEQYDVVDYDHEFLPFSRSEFTPNTLFTTRTVLLTQHLRHIKPPKPFSFRSTLGRVRNFYKLQKRLTDADLTVKNADLINVPNQKDAQYLITQGIPSSKVCVIPYGISETRKNDFRACLPAPPPSLKVVFLGSFDYRKGAMDFNYIFNELVSSYPDIKLLLLGTKGLFTNKNQILNFFDEKIHKNIEVVMSFTREDIGEYLKDCSVGIYPSYMEGFPFGILEMLSSYIPVFSYDAPGAGMMLPKNHLANPGDKSELAKKVISYIQNDDHTTKRINAHDSVSKFNWKDISITTINNYKRYK